MTGFDTESGDEKVKKKTGKFGIRKILISGWLFQANLLRIALYILILGEKVDSQYKSV